MILIMFCGIRVIYVKPVVCYDLYMEIKLELQLDYHNDVAQQTGLKWAARFG